MTLRTYLILMSITTAVCWGMFLLILYTIDPFATNWVGLGLFYTSLFLALTGTGAILGFLIRFIGLKHELIFCSVKAAFRQSFLFAFLLIAVLYLNAYNLFTWPNLFFLIVGLSILEFFLISYSSSRKRRMSTQDLENE